MNTKLGNGFEFKDLSARKGVEIVVRHDNLVVWVNVDGICVNRIVSNGMIPIEIDDRRNQPNPHSFFMD